MCVCVCVCVHLTAIMIANSTKVCGFRCPPPHQPSLPVQSSTGRSASIVGRPKRKNNGPFRRRREPNNSIIRREGVSPIRFEDGSGKPAGRPSHYCHGSPLARVFFIPFFACGGCSEGVGDRRRPSSEETN